MKNLPLILIALTLATPLQAAQLNTTSTLQDTIPPSTISRDAPEFAKVIDDLPLMPGLVLVEDNDVLFDAPKAGRIAETTAKGEVDVDEVYQFYRRSLPPLGWKVVDARSFMRENELLRIDAHADEKVTTVRFSEKPLTQK